MQTSKFIFSVFCVLFIHLGLYTASLSAKEPNTLANVDGQSITADMLAILQGSRQQGPLAELQQNQDELLESLITTELLYNAAKKSRLDTHKEIALELELAHKTLLSQFYVKQFMDQQHIDDATLKAAYDAQKPELMVRMAYWAFGNKAKAVTFLSNAKQGKLDTTIKGEELPWQRLENYPFAHLPEADSLTDGQWLSIPVQDELGWLVWRCLESSSIPKPSFDDAREGIRQELASQALHEHIAGLRAQAEIKLQYKDAE